MAYDVVLKTKKVDKTTQNKYTVGQFELMIVY